ncbi:MAG: 5'-3' exonuclease H3TH domain-containing protein [bacterium]
MPEHVVIVDGNALIHRGFHAIPNLSTSYGKPTNAVYGFTTIFLKVLQDLHPEYVIVTFDTKEPTFRHKEFPAYKAQRPKTDALLLAQFEDTHRLVKAFNIPVLFKPGYEADDLIGTIAKKLDRENPDLAVFIVTGDLDTLQLVNDHTKIYTSKRGLTETVIYDVASVYARFGFGPEHIIDYKALRGDPSDNIPGVPGIGEKTAMQLVKEFGSLESIYENLQVLEVSKRIRQILEDNHQNALLSKRLVTINCDVPIDFDLQACKYSEQFDRQQVIELFRELEFTSLIRKIPSFGTEQEEAASKKPTTMQQSMGTVEKPADVQYHLVATDEAFATFLDELNKQKAFAFDTELDSLNVLDGELLGISFSWKEKEAYYVAFTIPGKAIETVHEQWLPKLKSAFESQQVKKYGHNMKFDCSVLLRYGIKVSPISFDTMLAAYVLNPGSRVGLKNMALTEFGVSMTAIEDLIGKGKQQVTFAEVPLEQASDYSCADADMTWRLVGVLGERIEEGV